jgi:predicted DCC family thiol-disulfide oxidoreductase YuxK
MLPTPHDHPNAEVVIYDGHCQFCTAQVRRLHRWDGKKRLAFISLHDPFVADHYPDLSIEQMMQALYFIDRYERRHRSASAIRVISRRLPKLWPLALLLHIPLTLPIWNWGYQQIAKRRYRLTCESDACEIHFKSKDK